MVNYMADDQATESKGALPDAPRRLDRRALRRQETIEEILDIAEEVMS